MAGAGAAPPLITAENAALNFSTTAQLNPSQYNTPEQLLNNAGTAFLTTLPGWLVWVILLLALYSVPRVGRAIDRLLAASWRRSRTKAEQSPPAKVDPASVEVEAGTEEEAIRAGLAAFRLTKPGNVAITILQAQSSQDGEPGSPVRVRLTRQTANAAEAAATQRLPAQRRP